MKQLFPVAWERDCMHWRGRVLTGRYSHWCPDWDELPVDETCPEWPCDCASELRWERSRPYVVDAIICGGIGAAIAMGLHWVGAG